MVSGKSGYVQAPLSFKLPKSQTEEARQIIHLSMETGQYHYSPAVK